MSTAKRAAAVCYMVHEHPFAYATLTDFKPGMGMIQIHSDWGQYTAFWGSMGGTVAEFVTHCDSGYLQRCFRERMAFMRHKKEADGLLVHFMAHCWPRLREEILADLKEEAE